MQRFAADGGWCVLSYEERMEGSIILAAIGMPEDGRPIDFVIVLELFSLKRVQLLTPFDLSSYHFKAEMKPWNNVESNERGSRQCVGLPLFGGMAACMERAARTFLGNYFFTLMDALAR